MTEHDLYARISELFLAGKDIAIEPRVFDVFTGAARIIHIDESPLIVVSEPNMKDFEVVIKRVFDIVASAIMLIVMSPLFLLIALVVKLDSPGPVIYKQERVGLWGRTFNILKFRSMYKNSEADVPQLSQVGDNRITRVGRFLRKYRLDEMPQFWNILKGEMSIVGPRPERPYFVAQIMEKAPYYCLLYKVRPGLTSWGPVKVGYTDTMDKMLQRLMYDISYTENMSLVLDIKILLRTVGVLVDGKGQ
jgi:exopolysaccharide biosynthesis polyprenyl glycosylphosphotransferase